MIEIDLIKKEKGRVYKSEEIVRELFGLELLHDEEGAPLLDNGRFISISDTKEHWACAMSDTPIGIDIEELSRRVRPSIVRKFHKDEQEYLAVLSEGGREWTEELFSIWTRKEAWSKYTRKGLSIGFSKFSVLENSVEGVPLGSFAAKGIMFGFAGDTQALMIEKDYDAPMEQSALDYAAGLLDVRAYSESELAKKMQTRGYGGPEIAQALEKLRDYGFVNDRTYAETYAGRAAEGGKSSRRIEAELRQKGLEKDLAKEAASDHKEDEYARALGIAKSIAGNSFGDGASDTLPNRTGLAASFDEAADDNDRSSFEARKQSYAQRQKLAGKISRKLSALGYDAGIIYSVLEEIMK